MNTENISIIELLPQKPPFVLIDQLISCDDINAVSRFKIKENSIFEENGALIESGLIENIAQTCAARIGYLCKYVYFKPICIGYIGAIKSLNIYQKPKVDETLITETKIVNTVFNIEQIEAKILTEQNKIIAEGEIKLYLTDIAI